MITRKLATAAIIGLLLAAQPSWAQRAGEMRGAGGNSCGEFISAKGQTGADLFYAQWSMGFLSSYNMFSTHAQVRVPESATILLHAEKYCRENPLATYTQAAFSLLSDLGGWRSPAIQKN